MIKHCTVPWFIQEWFEHRHHNLCKKHDEEYVATLNPLKKLWSDVKVIWLLGIDSIISLSCFFVALFALPTLGTIYWAYKRIKERV